MFAFPVHFVLYMKGANLSPCNCVSNLSMLWSSSYEVVPLTSRPTNAKNQLTSAFRKFWVDSIWNYKYLLLHVVIGDIYNSVELKNYRKEVV